MTKLQRSIVTFSSIEDRKKEEKFVSRSYFGLKYSSVLFFTLIPSLVVQLHSYPDTQLFSYPIQSMILTAWAWVVRSGTPSKMPYFFILWFVYFFFFERVTHTSCSVLCFTRLLYYTILLAYTILLLAWFETPLNRFYCIVYIPYTVYIPYRREETKHCELLSTGYFKAEGKIAFSSQTFQHQNSI